MATACDLTYSSIGSLDDDNNKSNNYHINNNNSYYYEDEDDDIKHNNSNLNTGNCNSNCINGKKIFRKFAAIPCL